MSEPLLRLEVGPVAAEGCCVARHEGRVVFVPHALPGEVVLARLDEASRGPEAAGRRFWRAEAVEVLEPSRALIPHRAAVSRSPALKAASLPPGPCNPPPEGTP